MVQADDRDLALRAIRGDSAAFGELVHCHQTQVFNVAYRLLGNRPDAQDAAQETFIRAYRALASFDPSRPLGPWLKRIAVNVCLNRLEADRTAPLALDDDDESIGPHPGPGPEELTLARESNERVRAEILRLPPRYRAVIELRHWQDLSYVEMAEALRCPLSDVKSDLFRARKLLAQRLKGVDI
jgi:RNA polymerase sigma-70 factor (ECF subfamily)